MHTITISLPEPVYEALKMLALQDDVSIEQFVTVAVAEKVSALSTQQYLEQRAARASREKFEAVLAKVPSSEPHPDDVLPSTEPDEA